jgi:predicted RNase H-like HicB family nuclease
MRCVTAQKTRLTHPTWLNDDRDMTIQMNMIYWKSENFWLGKLVEHPEIMTQGETLEELEENLRDAYRMMVMEDVPESYQVKALAV